jgi:5-oxoprolinase (ATP-hydrolysing) subunit B
MISLKFEATIQRLGDTAIFCQFALPVTLTTQSKVWHLAEIVSRWPQVVESVPGMNNLMIIVDPLETDWDDMQSRLERVIPELSVKVLLDRSIVNIPVMYGGEYGPDLLEVARYTGLSAEEVVCRHVAPEYVVCFIGFLPGFAYLLELDPSLVTPRRTDPRVLVPAGSVGIGGNQTGIYPRSSPGGWQLIGKTNLSLFLPEQTPRLRPGDRLRFLVESIEI